MLMKLRLLAALCLLSFASCASLQGAPVPNRLQQTERAVSDLPPMVHSPALAQNYLVLGAKRFSIRNLIAVDGSKRSPASVRPNQRTGK
jgi:hypothetical protein